ncbi:hypothetical protein ACFQNE_02625 [Gordonia phosphorivorans]|uniref:Uncharacterized protein n=1 Tax=Gordonia phosphorivorans TaxID=1056982 RepID=A0ABV6H521_9ACTN
MFDNTIQRVSSSEAAAEFGRFAQEYPIMASGMKTVAMVAAIVLGMVLYIALIKAILRLPFMAAAVERLRETVARTRYGAALGEHFATPDRQRDGWNVRH